MRGIQNFQGAMFSYISLEDRVPKQYPLRELCAQVDALLATMSAEFDAVYSKVSRPSVRSERLFNKWLARLLFDRIKHTAGWARLTSDAHFSVDGGTLIDAWASHKSFRHTATDWWWMWPRRTRPERREREAALEMLQRSFMKKGATVEADDRYDCQAFVKGCRRLHITPHVASRAKCAAIHFPGRGGWQASAK